MLERIKDIFLEEILKNYKGKNDELLIEINQDMFSGLNIEIDEILYDYGVDLSIIDFYELEKGIYEVLFDLEAFFEEKELLDKSVVDMRIEGYLETMNLDKEEFKALEDELSFSDEIGSYE